ncbi:MAG: hypothetical protein RL662_156 [Bacteroidota bacterium]|jgi:hypothetical protein
MPKASSTNLLRLKRKLVKFYGILLDEYGCSDSFKCKKFITKNLCYGLVGSYKPRKKLRLILDRCGLEFLGAGSSRFVVGVGDLAIKLCKHNEDIDEWEDNSDPLINHGNETELLSYRKINKDKLRKLLIVPLLAHFKINNALVLVYPRLVPYEELFSDPLKGHILLDRYNVIRETACNWLFDDAGSHNFGMYKNQLFYLDFSIDIGSPSDFSHDEQLQKEVEKAVDDFKMERENMQVTKRYIEEMRAMV